MYTDKNYQTKKALKADVAAGKVVGFYRVGVDDDEPPKNGRIMLCGPHYPQAHKWYATATVKDGVIVKVS